MLRKLNADEPYSLFKCPKPYTLAITEFQTPTIVQPKSGVGAFFENIGLSKKQQVNGAALYAHNLAEMLSTKCGLKTYVLHTQYSSVVAVGEFSSVDDPVLLETQRLLSAKLNLGSIRLFPTPLPMQVPH